MQETNPIPNKITSNFVPILIWSPQQDPFQTKKASFLKKFPKYFSQKGITHSSLRDGKVFSRMKSIKTIKSLLVGDPSFPTSKPKKNLFIQSLLRNLLNVHKHQIKNFVNGKICGLVFYPEVGTPTSIRNLPNYETYYLDIYDKGSCRDFIFLKKLKELTVGTKKKVIQPMAISSHPLREHISKLRQLKFIKLKFLAAKDQTHHIYILLSELDQIVGLPASFETFVISLEGNLYNESLSLDHQNMNNISKYVTHLKMEYQSSFFANINLFNNLISLETPLFYHFERKVNDDDLGKFFKDLVQLKKLKSLALRVNPRISTSAQHIKDFFKEFSLPENIEHVSLEFFWFALYNVTCDIQPNKDLSMHKENPLEDYPICTEFAKKWENLLKLRSLQIKLTNGWDQWYGLNIYLVFLILRRISRLEEISLIQTISDSRNQATIEGGRKIPLDFGLFLENIRHLTPNLTKILVQDWGIVMRRMCLEEMRIELPKLKILDLKGKIVGGKCLKDFLKVFPERSDHKELTNEIRLDCMIMENEEAFGFLLGCLMAVPKGLKVFLRVNAWYLNTRILSNMLCKFLENGKTGNNLRLEIVETKAFLKNDWLELKQRLVSNPVFLHFNIKTRYNAYLPIISVKNGGLVQRVSNKGNELDWYNKGVIEDEDEHANSAEQKGNLNNELDTLISCLNM